MLIVKTDARENLVQASQLCIARKTRKVENKDITSYTAENKFKVYRKPNSTNKSTWAAPS